jgi:transcriptional regulator of acetoin/glycerol metabolism
MMQEILNIDYHKKQMLFKALNKFRNSREAADALGIGERTVYRMMRRYNIRRDIDGSYYYYTKEVMVLI